LSPVFEASGEDRKNEVNVKLAAAAKRRRYRNNCKSRREALRKRVDNNSNERKYIDMDNRPNIPVVIFKNHYVGIADSGADCCLIGSKLYAKLKKKNAKMWFTNKTIKLADGTTKVSAAIELNVKWLGGQVKMAFFVVQDDSSEIILGRPFLRYAKICLMPDGYFKLNKPDTIYKFVPNVVEKVQIFKATIAERRNIYSTLKSKIQNDDNGEIEKLITSYVTCGLFSEKVGLVKGVEAKIKMKDSIPYRATLRPTNNATKKIIDAEIDNWLDQKIIAKAEPGEAKFISPLHVVKKKKLPGETVQKFRVVCDTRALNSRCEPEPPLNPPRSELIFSKMAKAKYFSKLDLKNAYLQVGLHKLSQPLCCFNTHRGVFKFLRTPFGFVNSGKIFNDVMEKVMADIDPDMCQNYFTLIK